MQSADNNKKMRVEGKPLILIKTDVLIAYCARERRLIINKLNMCNCRTHN